MLLASVLRTLTFQRDRRSSRPSHNRARLNFEELEKREVPASQLALDFGPLAGPAAPGFTTFANQAYDSATGFGWVDPSKIQVIGQSTTGVLTQDSVQARALDFVADLANGSYDVTVFLGDAKAERPRVQIKAEGQTLDIVQATAAGEFITKTFTVAVTDGKLNLSFLSLGKIKPVTLNALRVTASATNAGISPPTSETVGLDFSTYLGGSGSELPRAVATDAQGNIYVAGGTYSANFPRTMGPAHQGDSDAFVTKFSANGDLIWSRLIGGANFERVYAIKVDGQGSIFVAGRAGQGFPTTTGAFQRQFYAAKANSGGDGMTNAFVAKLGSDGTVQWASYLSAQGATNDYGNLIRSLDFDGNGNLYVITAYNGGAYLPSVSKAFVNQPQGGSDTVLMKIAGDGTKVLWARYIGGSGFESIQASVAQDGRGNVYVAAVTLSSDAATTPGGYDRTYNGGRDMYLAKFGGADGSLIFGTYLGGTKNEDGETHFLAVNGKGEAIVGAISDSANFPTTPGALQTQYGGSGGPGTGANTNHHGDLAIAKFSADGSKLLAATFLGGSQGDGLEGIAVDSKDNVYVSGGTYSDDFPVTVNAIQKKLGGGRDGVVAKLSPDLKQALYVSYLGGKSDDLGRALAVASTSSQVNVYVTGATNSDDFPLANAWDGTYSGAGDGFLAKLAFRQRTQVP